ncbi:hypothetical protein [Agrobacterium tumefaciens]|uniref:hypothetical protein n=1 Tax=Agrobacterium tumefaciens TaxID=358 RepID=UPI0021D0DDB2|nr:hypothetical protein [Agrobacterium tumefaciens]UXS09221.1 hypothetical protein FY155_06210 [Agrobacterium tumefaciens]UXS16580.1 hypothetical protein FY154_06205 [Agrobacterium tumefaciens]
MAILKVLSRSADDVGVAEIKQQDVANKTGLSRRTVIRSMATLERLMVLSKSKQLAYAKRGRPADLVTLSINQDFTLTKESIMSAKEWDQSDKMSLNSEPDLGDKMSLGPKEENSPAIYIDRARGVLVESSPLKSSSSLSVSTHVRFDRGRSKWRATITAMGVTMDLGRFDIEEDANVYAAQSEVDVRRTASMKAGMPSFPVIDPLKEKMDAPDIGPWLFGDDDAEDCENSAGEASALGQGTKFLAGMGRAHAPAETDAARTRDAA